MDELLRGANRFSALFEMMPLALAVLVSVLALRPLHPSIGPERKVTIRLAGACALLLLIAQSSWWVSYVWRGQLADTVLANAIWTIFNSLVMVVLFRVVKTGVSNG